MLLFFFLVLNKGVLVCTCYKMDFRGQFFLFEVKCISLYRLYIYILKNNGYVIHLGFYWLEFHDQSVIL